MQGVDQWLSTQCVAWKSTNVPPRTRRRTKARLIISATRIARRSFSRLLKTTLAERKERPEPRVFGTYWRSARAHWPASGFQNTTRARVEEKIGAGAILIAVGSDEPARLDRAFRVFKSSGAEEVYWARILQLKHARGARCELRGHIRIKHHHQPDDEGEKDAVLERKPKEPAFIFPLHCRCGSGNGNAGQADHLSHHAAGRVS